MIHGSMPAANGICLVMDMPRWMVRIQKKPFDVFRAEVKYTRLVMIDPNDRMIVIVTHGVSPFLIEASRRPASGLKAVHLRLSARRLSLSNRT